jgi:hypothetical protein
MSPADFKAWVSARMSEPETAVPLLENLSLLEFIGAKMILRSYNPLSSPYLCEHAMEEVIHGQIVGDAARDLEPLIAPDRLAGIRRASERCFSDTRRYYRKVHVAGWREVGRALADDQRFNELYSVICYLIECRMMLVFPSIESSDTIDSVKAMARKVISDEQNHLKHVSHPSRDLVASAGLRLDRLMEEEDVFCSHWVEAMDRVTGPVRVEALA